MSRHLPRTVSRLLLAIILVSLPTAAIAAPSAPAAPLPVIQISEGLEFNATPAVARAADGRVWVVWQSDVGGGEVVRGRYTTDSGATWSDETQLTDDFSVSLDPALAATPDGTLWLVFSSETEGIKDIWYQKSTDSGDTWTGAQQLTNDAHFDTEPAIGVTGSSSLVVAWRSQRSGLDEIWYQRTANGGTDWTAEAQLSIGGSANAAPTLATAPNGTLWAVWERVGLLILRTSPNGGADWTPESSLAGPYGAELSPALAVAGTTMWLFSACDADICYRSSADSGANWSAHTELSSYVQIDEDASAGSFSATEVAVVWESQRNTSGTSDVFLGIPGVREDDNPPYVGPPTRTPPGNPEPGQTVSLSCFADDETSVAGVSVVWSKNSVSQTNLTMLDNGVPPDVTAADGDYAVNFPALASGDVVSYQCVATDGEANSTATPVESFTVVPPFVKTANILLVMDQTSQVNDQPLPRYVAALDATGLAYDVWNSALRGPIDSLLLPQYLPGGKVVWAVPDNDAYLYADATQRDALRAFLDGGGDLFVSGQDVAGGLWSVDNPFLEDYLHGFLGQNGVGIYEVGGVAADPIGDTLALLLESTGPMSQELGDEVHPLAPAELFLTWTGFVPPGAVVGAASPARVDATGGAGIHAVTVDYEVVTLSFGLEGIINAGSRVAVLGRSLAWLGECTLPSAPAGLAVTRDAADLLLSWQDTAGDHHELWFSTTDPYFTPGGTCTGPACTAQVATALTHVGVGADLTNDHFYTVRSVGSCDDLSPSSSRVGNVTFGLVPGS